jgi:Protein of unknown function (DUF1553)/Protein of unknown function (DUF1549)
MIRASERGWRRGRFSSLLFGVLFLTGAFGLFRLTDVAAQEKKGAQDSTTKKGAETPLPAWPAPLKMKIVSKDSDVAEMAGVINSKLEASWKANKIVPSGYVDDFEFIRRASLDIVGRIATTAEIAAYMKDPPETRRSLLIERLLRHEDYARHWANLWSNWLLTRAGPFGRGMYKDQMTVWLEDQFAQNKSYADMVPGLLTAKGKNTDNGAVNYVLAHLGEPIRVEGRGNDRGTAERVKEEGHFEMVPLTSRMTRLFLGTQIQCAQCHPHPFSNSIKQEHFWRINAFLRQVNRVGNPVMMRNMPPTGPLELVDDEGVNSEAKVYYETRAGKFYNKQAEFLPITGKDRGPKLDPSIKGVGRRQELAKDLVEHDMFPKAIVNRMWGLFMGRGFVNPIDDFNDNNQPVHPELLEELSARFKHYNYDMKKLIRWITHSNAYHLSYVANRTNDKQEFETQFSRMNMKALSPEQLFESLMVATKAEQAESAEAKKTLRNSWLRNLISNFGDDEGNEVNFNGTIVQALMMMNGEDINKAISRPDKGTVALALKSSRSSDMVIRELYLTALNRPPSASELSLVHQRLRLVKPASASKDTAAAQYQDLFWALLNSNEFLLNH